jgi:glycosyltransferase involved in cell wall biosynthesis
MRLAVVSPFLDRAHGTESVVAEQIERLARNFNCEIHLYSQNVRDLALSSSAEAGEGSPGQIVWRKVTAIPGPLLLRFLWWYFANRRCRRRDRQVHGRTDDLLFSPGINAADADAIAVHIVFHELYRQVRPQLALSMSSLAGWPRILHRRLYYRLITRLENKIYRDPRVGLSAVSGLVARQLAEHFQRTDVTVIRHGVDAERFSPAARLQRRAAARSQFDLAPADFALLFIGNDWRIKGLSALLRAIALCGSASLKLLVVGEDQRSVFEHLILQLGLKDSVLFRSPSADVVQFYSAADAYVGPSLEDAYGLPILEAMACGLPVVASVRAGASEIMRHGVDGLLLQNPEDHHELAALILRLVQSGALCKQLGEAASESARHWNWERNARETYAWLESVAEGKKRSASGASQN